MRSAPVSVTHGDAWGAASFSLEEAYEYANLLRIAPQAANPAGWRVDWDDAPWPVKVYSGGKRIVLGANDPDGNDLALGPLARVLHYSLTISRVRLDRHGGLPPTPNGNAMAPRGPRLVARRPIPSGGAMYPTEAYAVIAQRGVYHYDPYRHELIELPYAASQRDLCTALGFPRADLPAVIVVLTSRFWKNFYKYGDFGYRLGAVDAGVALGRMLRLAHEEFGRITVGINFDDAMLATCLGIDSREESAYAVIGMGRPTGASAYEFDEKAGVWPTAVLERSRAIRQSPSFAAMHSAAIQPAPAATETDRCMASGRGTANIAEHVFALPRRHRTGLNDRLHMLRRTSNGALFTGEATQASTMSSILQGATQALSSLHRSCAGRLGRDIRLYCAVHHVSEVPAGWYRYLPETGSIAISGVGADAGSSRELQECMLAATINIELAAFTVHIAAWKDYRRAGRGARGYREQQLAVGAAVEALTLLGDAAGLGSHPILGFDVERVEQAYGLSADPHGVHAQVSFGRVRPDLNWEISVMQR
jgi:SagB-type dehydrogenase family enzyme